MLRQVVNSMINRVYQVPGTRCQVNCMVPCIPSWSYDQYKYSTSIIWYGTWYLPV